MWNLTPSNIFATATEIFHQPDKLERNHPTSHGNIPRTAIIDTHLLSPQGP